MVNGKFLAPISLNIFQAAIVHYVSFSIYFVYFFYKVNRVLNILFCPRVHLFVYFVFGFGRGINQSYPQIKHDNLFALMRKKIYQNSPVTLIMSPKVTCLRNRHIIPQLYCETQTVSQLLSDDKMRNARAVSLWNLCIK